MSHAYLRTCSQAQLWEDCYEAVCGPLDHLSLKLQTERAEVRELIEDKQQMSVIYEEENTQREQISSNFQDKIKNICVKFNAKIRMIKNFEKIIDEILNIYKQELQSIAVDLKASEENNVKLKNQIKKYSKKQLNIEEKKEVIKENIQKNIEIINDKINQKNIQKKNQKTIETANWKFLSGKIQILKKKIQTFQQQINEKDQIIKNLTKKLTSSTQQNNPKDQQIKKLKHLNTTLRGEKVLQTNQLSTIKKQLQTKISLCQTQQIEIKKLKMEIENITSTIKWQSTLINDLKQNYGKQVHISVNESISKIKKLESINSKLMRFIAQQEESLKTINEQTKAIELNIDKKNDAYEKKILDLQSILDEKNQSIIKLKSASKGISLQKGSNYQNQMIKLLTKKLTEKDEQIRRLKKLDYKL